MNNNEINFRTPRTMVGTAMEIVVAMLVIAMWTMAIYLFQGAAADTIQALIWHSLFCTFLPFLMLVSCYFPKTFSMPVRRPRAEHYLLTVEMIRVCCIALMPILLAATWKIGRPDDAKAAEGMQAVFGLVITLIVAYYIVRLIRMR